MIYLCILVIAALQFVVAYSNITPTDVHRMLILACVEAALALLFFMHLWRRTADSYGLLSSLRCSFS